MTAPTGINITHEQRGEATLVTVSGELDLYSLDEFKAILQAAEQDNHSLIVLDLRELGFIDSSGLGSIIGLQGRMQRENRRLVICPSEVVTKTFDVTGLYRVLKTSETPEAVL